MEQIQFSHVPNDVYLKSFLETRLPNDQDFISPHLPVKVREVFVKKIDSCPYYSVLSFLQTMAKDKKTELFMFRSNCTTSPIKNRVIYLPNR